MISIVIPVINEEQQIGDCLEKLCAQPGDYEIIVVDGGSQDNTAAIIAACQRAQLAVATKGRGSQMNAGARAAQGEWLLFLHVDTRLADEALIKLTEIISRRNFQAGCFRHRFDSRHPWLRIVSFFHNLRFRLTGIIYGDQGMLIRRDLFFRLGGFKESIVMEDIEFSERLLKVAKPICLPLTVITSARKFHAIGVYRATIKVLQLMRAYDRNKDMRKDIFFSDFR